jgi:phage anti-repressor protein
MSCDYSDNWSVWFSENFIITVLKSVAKKRVVKTKDFYVSCNYSENWSVWFSETVIITVLKSVAKKRLVKTNDFYESSDCSNNWSVFFSGTVIVGCGGEWSIDPIFNPKLRRETLSHVTVFETTLPVVNI